MVKSMPGQPQGPSLAESWTVSKDGTVVDFALREGVTFHNGDPFTAEDVRFSMQPPAVESPSRAMFFLRSRTRSARQGFGQPVLRREDARLLTGTGCYSDDVNLPSQAYASFVRSPHAHARVRTIDIADALTVPGVIAVLTAEDVAADGLKPIPHRPVPANPHEPPLRSRDGSPFYIAPHPPLALDRARFEGEAVAMVVADTAAVARDAVERIRVDYAMEYVVPRADALPRFTTELSEVPSTTNPLGLRGGGEGGTTPALGAVVNAIVDALAELGVEHIEMPATPERVWRAIHSGRTVATA
jgi:CO/xanthine dehydrogenase Mo-binding subunit